MFGKSRLHMFLLSIALFGVGASLWAATQNALVTGTVFDQGGAPVAEATVRLINASIGFSQSQTTDAEGRFTFGNVPPAENYIISVERAGFATLIRPGLTIAVGDARLVLPPFLLQPATQPQQEIREEAPAAPQVALDLVSTTLSGVVDSVGVRTLPLSNRDFLDLALLVPGTYPVEQGSALEGASLVVNGVRANMNNFLLDGADNNDYTVNQSLPFQIVEALQEFRVQTSTSNAEFGRNAGAQINSVSRSGSNDVHGTLFWFFRDAAVNAQNAFSAYRGGTFDAFANAARVDKLLRGAGTFFPTAVMDDPALSSLFEQGRDPDVVDKQFQNQFGANIGGPIVKDKAFIFFNWESFRADIDRPLFERVPDTFFRGTTFFDIFGRNASTERVNELLNLYPVPNVPLSTVTDVFGLPVSDPQFGDFSCIAVAQQTGVQKCTSGAFFVGDSRNFTDSDNLLTRIDLRPNERVNMSFKHNIQRISQVQGGALPETGNYPGSGIRLKGRNQNFSYNYVHLLGQRANNEFRFGWNRFRLTNLPLDRSLDPSSLFGNLNFSNRGLPRFLTGGVDFTTAPYADLGANYTAPFQRANNVWSWADNLSVTWGKHVLKAGVELRHNRLNVNNEALGRGLVTLFSVPFGAGTGLPDLASIARVSPEFGGGFDRSFSSSSFDWFLQDTWRPRQNISLTLGIRHEINQAPGERRNRLVNNYPEACDALGTTSFVCLIRSGTNTVFDRDGNILGTAGFSAPEAGFKTDWNNIGPHLGLAWDPWSNGKTVFRGGYAITFDQQTLEPSVNMLHNPPFVYQAQSLFPFFELADTFPGGFPGDFNLFPGLTAVDLDNNGFSSFWFRQPYSIVARDPGTRSAYIHQWNLGLQQRLGSSSLFEIAYVGSAGHKLPRNRLQLECTPAILFNFPPDCLRDELVIGGFIGGDLTGTLITQENSANSNFHSLQIRWETRSFKGLTLRLHYQWAHSIDGASSAIAPIFLFSPAEAALLSQAQGINVDNFAALNNANPTLSLRPGLPIITTRPLVPNDSTNLAGERASSDFDIRHRFILNYIYDVPRFAPTIGEGWQLAGITTIQSGQPYSVYDDFFGVPLRPDVAGRTSTNNDNAGAVIDSAVPLGCNSTFTCFGTNVSSSFDVTPNVFLFPGNLGRNTFKGPGLVNFDFSILKNTYLGGGERVNLQFRMEVFNLFNSANYRQPFAQAGQSAIFPTFNAQNQFTGFAGRFVPNPFFGQILQSRTAREFQFGVKLIF